MERLLLALFLLGTIANNAPCQDSLNVTRLATIFTYNNAADEMTLADGILYVCQFDSGVALVNVSNPNQPELVKNIKTFTPAFDFALSDSLIFIGTRDSGLFVIDASDTNNFKQVGNLQIDDSIFGLFKEDSILYMAASDLGLIIVDVSDPTNPQRLSRLSVQGYAYDVYVHDNLAFVSSFTFLHIIDISHPGDPSVICTMDMSFGVPMVCVRNDILYVDDSDAGLKVYDINDPFNPELLGTFKTRGLAAGVEVSGNLAFIGACNGGIQVVDIGDLDGITEVGFYDTPGTAQYIVLGDSGLVYLGDYTNLGIYRYIPANGISTDEPNLHPTTLALVTYPNPFNSTTTARFMLPAPGLVVWSVTDEMGRMVLQSPPRFIASGEHTLIVNAASWPSGAYFVRLETGQSVLTERMVKVK